MGGHVEAPMSLNELAGRRDDRLLLGHHLHDLVLVVLDREDELAEERLMVFLPQSLVALREVIAFLDLHALEGLDQLHRVFPTTEPGPLDAELQEIHGLEVRLHVAIRQRARRIDLLESGDGLVEEFPVVRRVQRREQAQGTMGGVPEAPPLYYLPPPTRGASPVRAPRATC